MLRRLKPDNLNAVLTNPENIVLGLFVKATQKGDPDDFVRVLKQLKLDDLNALLL
jgi:hypothetical protein